MRTVYGLFCVAFCLFLGLPASRGATSLCSTNLTNIVANCGFETGNFTAWTLTGNDVPGELGNLYGVERADPFPLPGGTTPNSGSFQAFFADQAANPTTLSQLLATTPGVTYTVSFYLAQQLVGPGSVDNSVDESLGGVSIQSLTGVPVQDYTFYSGTVTASSSASLLSLTFGNDIGEFVLDDVAVATPEPATWLLFLTGVVATGLFYRRRFSSLQYEPPN